MEQIRNHFSNLLQIRLIGMSAFLKWQVHLFTQFWRALAKHGKRITPRATGIFRSPRTDLFFTFDIQTYDLQISFFSSLYENASTIMEKWFSIFRRFPFHCEYRVAFRVPNVSSLFTEHQLTPGKWFSHDKFGFYIWLGPLPSLVKPNIPFFWALNLSANSLLRSFFISNFPFFPPFLLSFFALVLIQCICGVYIVLGTFFPSMFEVHQYTLRYNSYKMLLVETIDKCVSFKIPFVLAIIL